MPINQPGHGLALVHGVRDHPLRPRRELDRFDRRLIRDAVDRPRIPIHQRDLVVAQLRLGQENGLDLLRGASGDEGPAIVILTSFDYPQFMDAALRLGASGYVLKTDPFAKVVDAIRQVAAGGFVYTARPSRADHRHLSPRELEVVSLVVDGHSNDEVAQRLGISVKTVESHLTRIFERLQVASRAELATRALREGRLEGLAN